MQQRSKFMDSQSQDDSLGLVSPRDIPKSQVVSTGHSMETGKAELEKLCGGIGGDYDELSYYGTYLINICLVVTY